MPDSHRPTIFKPPEEPPLGYEAIRDWLQKPRPLLRRAFGWIPLLLSKLYDAGVFIRKNARPGAEWVQEAVRKAQPLVQAGAKIGKGVRNVGHRMSAAAGAFRDPEGKHLGTEGKVRRAGKTTQVYGERITAGSEFAGSILSLFGAMAGVFTPEKPISIDLRESVPEDAGETPESDGRVVPRQPDKRPSEAAGGRTEPVPKLDEPSIDTESGGDDEETPAELPDEAPDSGDAEKEPVEAPDQQPDPGHADESSPESPDKPPGAGDAEEDSADSRRRHPSPIRRPLPSHPPAPSAHRRLRPRQRPLKTASRGCRRRCSPGSRHPLSGRHGRCSIP